MEADLFHEAMTATAGSLTRPTIYQRYRVKSHLQFRCDMETLPETIDGDYWVRVDVCGLCRSDLYSATSWAHDWEDLGHEFGGTVVAARDPQGKFKVGDRVAVKNAAACLECPSCKAGNVRECQRLVVNKQGFSQYAQCDERSLVLAGDLDNDLLALVEPVNVVLDLLFSAALTGAERILILGSGTLGLLTGHLAMHRFGFQTVLIAGRRPESVLASELGLPYATLEQAGQPDFLRKTLGGRPGRVLVTTPPATLPLALEACGAGGRILTVGLDREESSRAEIDVQKLIFKRAQIRGVFAVPNLYFEEAVDVLKRVGAPVRRLIHRRIPFLRLEEAFREWNARGHFDGKTILCPQGQAET